LHTKNRRKKTVCGKTFTLKKEYEPKRGGKHYRCVTYERVQGTTKRD